MRGDSVKRATGEKSVYAGSGMAQRVSEILSVILQARWNRPFAKMLVDEVAGFVSSDPELSGRMIKNIRRDHNGKPRGARKWTSTRRFDLWCDFLSSRQYFGNSQAALQLLAEHEGLSSRSGPKKIADHIAQARKAFPIEALPQHLRHEERKFRRAS